MNLYLSGQVGLGEFPSSEESSSGWENSDSAVESSDDDEEEMKEGDEEDSDDSESDSSGDKKDFSGLFGPDGKQITYVVMSNYKFVTKFYCEVSKCLTNNSYSCLFKYGIQLNVRSIILLITYCHMKRSYT